MYEWALSVLQKAHMNDRAKLQAWLRKRGYELGTFELPESKYQQLERERDAAVEQLKEVDRLELFCCSHCKHEELDDFSCTTCLHMSNWEWIGAQEVE